jgi:hypothetical protein
MKKIAIIILTAFSFMSCEKEIDLDLNTANSKIVIEGKVAQDQLATVQITKTVNFSDANNFPGVRAAEVKITDNAGVSEILKETAPGIYAASKMKGEEGKTYTMIVITEGKTFTAKSTMPKAIKFAGLRSELSKFAPPGAEATNYIIYPQFIDPAEAGNNYRFIQSNKEKTDKSLFIANDAIGNGQPNQRPLFSRDFEVKIGDVVTVEMQCLDKPAYDYFYSLFSIGNNGPGGGATPTNPVSNISGGALGYFSAYTSQKQTIEIK